MGISFYIGDMLNGSEATFRRVVSTIIGKSIKRVKIELVRQHIEVDMVLFEAIKSILKDLRAEEGFVGIFLYKYFNINILKNKKREQLLILGGQFKTQYNRLKTEIGRVDVYIKNMVSIIENLVELKKGFNNKNRFLVNGKDLDRSNFFIKRINREINELNRYKSLLEQKYRNLKDIEKIYSSLKQEIPRYNELKEESYLKLLK
jgi:hypothetical protein